MKSLAVLAAAGILLASGTLNSAAPAHASHQHLPAVRSWFSPMQMQPWGHLQSGRVTFPMDSATATVGPSATSTPPVDTPTPTPTTGPAYPDAQTVLNNMLKVMSLIKAVHFEEIVDVTGTPTLHADLLGDANCTSLKGHFKAVASVPGTQQTQKADFYVIVVKKALFRKSKATKNTWQPAKTKQLNPFSVLPADQNPLPCSTPATSGGTGSGGTSPFTETIRDLHNAGPETFAGNATWRIRATLVVVDTSTNETIDIPLDWNIDQKHGLLYSSSSTEPHLKDGYTIISTEKYSKFGVKVTISKPKKGAKKP